MDRYRITTPDTPRAPCSCCADFAQADEVESPVCVRHVMENHNFTGCTVHRKRRGNHWEMIFDSTSGADVLWWVRWQNVELSQ